MSFDSAPAEPLAREVLPQSAPATKARTLKQPASHRPHRLLALMLPPSIALFAVFQGLLQILLPAHVERIDAAHKVENLAALTAAGAIASAIGIVAGGALSDRSFFNWGRRAPWLMACAIVGAALLLVLPTQTSILGLGVFFTTLWFTMNFYQGALTALLPDQIPERMRGLASSIVGLGMPLGILLGVNLAARLSQATAYIALGVIFFAATTVLVLGVRESRVISSSQVRSQKTSSTSGERRTALKNSLAQFFSSFRSADFTYAFIGRMLMFLSFFAVAGFQYYMLTDYIGVENLPGRSPESAMAFLGTIQTVCWIVAISLAGWLSDRLDRRKLFVGVCSLGMAFAMLIPVLSPTWSGIVAFQVCVGIFFGIFTAVDVALISLVLPDEDAAGRDMALLSVAGLPALAATVVAASIIRISGYEALFLFGFVTSLLGGLIVFRIRAVR